MNNFVKDINVCSRTGNIRQAWHLFWNVPNNNGYCNLNILACFGETSQMWWIGFVWCIEDSSAPKASLECMYENSSIACSHPISSFHIIIVVLTERFHAPSARHGAPMDPSPVRRLAHGCEGWGLELSEVIQVVHMGAQTLHLLQTLWRLDCNAELRPTPFMSVHKSSPTISFHRCPASCARSVQKSVGRRRILEIIIMK